MRFRTRGWEALAVSVGAGALALGLAIGVLSDVAGEDLSRKPGSALGWVAALAVFGVLIGSMAWASAGIWLCGVFAEPETLRLRQLSSWRRFARDDVAGATNELASGLGVERHRLRVLLNDGGSIKCELYGRNQRPTEAEAIAAAVSRWAGDADS